MNGSVRSRSERAYIDSLYENAAKRSAKTPEQIAEQTEQERLARLRTAASEIEQQEVALHLAQSEMDADELDIIYRRILAENPNALASVDVWNAQLLKIRAEGGRALEAALHDATRKEKLQVLEALAGATPEERQGLDQGVAAREKLRKIRSDAWLEGDGQ